MGPSPDDSGVVPIGAVLDGRYRIDKLLGKGGMGRVYGGEHTSLGRAVAIKVLHANLGNNKEAAARFQREALASGRLDHPNIVGVSDFGVMEDGCLYLVMEALEGEELGARLLRDRRLAWPEASEIIRGVLAGLRHAHERGVIHRDIKPDNIFVAKKEGEQVVKILDFGIAKLYVDNAGDPATTRAGLTVGTPAYLSPEQAVGGAITPASDLYSTSVVFYEMLAGRPPFEDKDPLAIMTAHVSREPPSFADIAPGLQLPAGLEQVIRKGLTKISAERTNSAADYLAQIDEVLRAAGMLVNTAPRASGQMVIPTPPPGSLQAAFPHTATPAPSAMKAVVAAPTAAFTPMPFAGTRQTTAAEVNEPIPRKWLVIAGIVLLAAIVIAIALKVGGGGGSSTPKRDAPKRGATSDPSPEPAPAPKRAEAPAPPAPKHDDPPPTKSDPAPAPVEAPAVAPATTDKDTQFKAALHDLYDGKTCTDRKAAIAQLVALGDSRAIKHLKAVRYRMRGGVLGIGDSNTNACLKADADAAIKELGGTVK